MTSVDYTPKTIDTSTGAKTVTVTVGFTDDLSGVNSLSACFRSPSGATYACGGTGLPPSTSSTKSFNASFSQYSEQGTWTLYYVNLTDAAGRYTYVYPAALQAAGFPTSLVNASSFTLTVQRSGAGSGNVVSSPPGISCGQDCTEAYQTGTQVTFTASADGGSVFQGWSGVCTGTGACVLTITFDTAVTASFAFQPPEHFGRYKTRAKTQFPQLQVLLDDQFGPNRFKVEKAVSLYVPTDKSGEGIVDADTHLVGYRIKQVGERWSWINGVQVNNQFGSIKVNVCSI